MGKVFMFALALQHHTALEIWGWDCVSPHCHPGDGRVQQQGQGFGCTLQHGVLQRTWPQVVLLHLGSTEGHQEQPCVSVTTRVGLCSPRSLSQRSPQSCFVTQAELKP